MAFNYAGVAGSAAKLLAEFGKTITLRTNTIGVYDPATGLNTVTTADIARKGAMFDFAAAEVNAAGGLIQFGDKKLLLEVGTVPLLHHKILDGTREYSIIGIRETNPAGTPVLYTLHLRE